MAPYIFYRVEDEDSRARYIQGRGIMAEDENTRVNLDGSSRELCDVVENQLNWRRRIPSVFISTYCDEGVARSEAERRIREGKEAVVVYVIDIGERDRPVEYRNMRTLAERLGVYIPDCAWNNSRYEYVFLHHVPESTIQAWLVLG